jgi:uncharacterized Tic20 family protein
MKRCELDKSNTFKLLMSKNRETVLFLFPFYKILERILRSNRQGKEIINHLIHYVLYSLLCLVIGLETCSPFNNLEYCAQSNR